MSRGYSCMHLWALSQNSAVDGIFSGKSLGYPLVPCTEQSYQNCKDPMREIQRFARLYLINYENSECPFILGIFITDGSLQMHAISRNANI